MLSPPNTTDLTNALGANVPRITIQHSTHTTEDQNFGCSPHLATPFPAARGGNEDVHFISRASPVRLASSGEYVETQLRRTSGPKQ